MCEAEVEVDTHWVVGEKRSQMGRADWGHKHIVGRGCPVLRAMSSPRVVSVAKARLSMCSGVAVDGVAGAGAASSCSSCVSGRARYC